MPGSAYPPIPSAKEPGVRSGSHPLPNNCYRDHAVDNAAMLAKLLTE